MGPAVPLSIAGTKGRPAGRGALYRRTEAGARRPPERYSLLLFSSERCSVRPPTNTTQPAVAARRWAGSACEAA
jgi:hypothetical protein